MWCERWGAGRKSDTRIISQIASQKSCSRRCEYRNNVNDGLPPLPFTPTYDFETFSTTFEDPFSYSRPYENAPGAETDPAFPDEGASPHQLDDKLLGFSAPIIKASVVDENGAFSELGMAAELYGMFFVAEDVFGGETTGRPLELTCYRRNLWQCSGQITLPRHVSHVVNEQGRQVQIFDLAASITAFESIEGKATEIISIPWKSAALAATTDGQHHQETKTASAPPRVPLDISGAQEIDGHRVSVPVSWKRLQFKSATANNGRRKGLQQHYVVQINLLAKIKTGEYMKIAEIQSGPVIVRGRSPRNFDSKKDVPLTASATAVDKSGKGTPTEKTRTQSDVGHSANSTPQLKTERIELSQNLHRYHSLGNAVHSTGSNEWNANIPHTPTPGGYGGQPGSAHANKKLAVSPSLSRPPVPTWGSNSSNPHKSSISGSGGGTGGAHPNHSGFGSSVPINLSLSEDERSPNNRSNSDLQSPQLPKSGVVVHTGSPVEEADLLYEYFPLSVDDW